MYILFISIISLLITIGSQNYVLIIVEINNIVSGTKR